MDNWISLDTALQTYRHTPSPKTRASLRDLVIEYWSEGMIETADRDTLLDEADWTPTDPDADVAIEPAPLDHPLT